MYSVTGRIRVIKQPRGGYISRKQFTVSSLDDGIDLNENENINPSLIGLVVDYMTRFLMGALKEEAFEISLLGAEIAKDNFNAYRLLDKIKGLDYESVDSACKLVGYDVCFRAGMMGYKSVEEIKPDIKTINNIVTMIRRSLHFWNEYGPIVKDGFTFEGGYTPVISTGDGDYLTKDTLWDFKVSKKEINSEHTLQLLIYYIMGKHSVHKEFDSIKRLGIYNPRLNIIYLLNICDIPKDVIDIVSHDIIGYGLSKEEIRELRKKELSKSENYTRSTKIQCCNDLDKKIYGYSSKKEYISKAFPTRAKIKDFSTYNGEPIFWKGSVPAIVLEKNLSYIIRFKACFKIKNKEKAFVMNKTSFLWSSREPLETSDIYDPQEKKYYAYYKNSEGKITKAKPTLILTSDDFQLFKKVYDVKELEILDGCYFF